MKTKQNHSFGDKLKRKGNRNKKYHSIIVYYKIIYTDKPAYTDI